MLLIFVDWASTDPERIFCGYGCFSYDYHISKLIGGILGTGVVTALLYFAFSSNKNKELEGNNLQTKHKHKIFDFSKRRSLISSIIISLLIYLGSWWIVIAVILISGVLLVLSGAVNLDSGGSIDFSYSANYTAARRLIRLFTLTMLFPNLSVISGWHPLGFLLFVILPRVVLVLLIGLISKKRGYTSLKNYLVLIVIFFFPIISLIYLPVILSRDNNAKLDN